MKVLIISNYFPPNYVGGYELYCKDVADSLVERGHEVRVLTSKDPSGKFSRDETSNQVIDRKLILDTSRRFGYIFKKLYNLNANLSFVHSICNSFEPHLIYVWNIGNLPKMLCRKLESMRVPLVFHFEDTWLTEMLSEKSAHKTTLKTQLRQLHEFWHGIEHANSPIRVENAIFASEFLKLHYQTKGMKPILYKVIHNGLPKDWISHGNPKEIRRRILYVGRVEQDKGVDDIVRALALLMLDNKKEEYTLTIVGAGSESYRKYLDKMVKEHQLETNVFFLGQMDRSQLKHIYESHGVLVFSSILDEGFGLTQIESMACGTPVISTCTGGSAEIVKHGWNGLRYRKNDPIDLSKMIRQLLDDERLYQRFVTTGIETVRQRFQFDHKIIEIDNFLIGVLEKFSASQK